MKKTLYVPFALEAMIKDNTNKIEQATAAVAPDYTGIRRTFIGSKLEPAPDQHDKALPFGIHLHFILPSALTKGRQNENGITTYPNIPNRWLVTRLYWDDGKPVANRKRWFVESDYIGTDNTDSITIPIFSDDYADYRFLGRCYPYEEEFEISAGEYLPNLTAVGPGDPTFAAYYPSCRSVLGFHDSAQEDDVRNGADFTYYVIGWHHDEKDNPLFGFSGSSIKEKLNELNWSVPDETVFSNEDTISCLYHGMVYGVKWRGKNADYPSGLPVGVVNASTGNSSVEALSAMIDKNQERFLCALQNDLIDELMGIDGLADAEGYSHENGFNRVNGGIKWDIRIKETKTTDTTKPIIPQKVRSLLVELNRIQAKCNSTKNSYDSYIDALYSAWYIYMLKYEEKTPFEPTPPTKGKIQTEIKSISQKLDTLQNEYQTHETNIEKNKQAVLAELDEAVFSLVNVNEGDYFSPKDPVVLLGGDGIKREYAFGEDGRFTQDGTLACQVEFNSSQISPIAISEWAQPWITLFLEWNMYYYPTKDLIKPEPDTSMDGWIFCDTDYIYEKDPLISSENFCEYKGRTVLTPHSTLLLADTVKKYLKRCNQDPELQKYLEHLSDKIKDVSILSQNLTGFTKMLTGKRYTIQLPPMAKNDEDIDITSLVRKYTKEHELTAVNSGTNFLPIRSGFFKINKINAVNTFGQLQLLDSQLKNTIFSEQLTHNVNKDNYGMLSPRISQETRLNFQWVEDQETNLSPICGFLIPNLLNHELMVYDTNGEFKGMLRLQYRNKTTIAQWITAPHLPQTDFEDVVFSNIYVKNFIASILGYNKTSDQAFCALLEVIDNRLAEIFAEGQDASQDLSVLWGRPLVLARAEITLELKGEPAYSMKYEDFGNYTTHGFEKIQFPVFIGDSKRVLDGTIGFFVDNEFSKFHLPHDTAKAKTDSNYTRYNENISMPLSEKKKITLLVEANTKTNIRTGILPPYRVGLPSAFTKDALSVLSMAFQINPIISDSEEINIPFLKESDMDWMWLHRTKEGFDHKPEIFDPKPTFGDNPAKLIDGYLIRKKRGLK